VFPLTEKCFSLTGKCFSLTNFLNDKQIQESLENDFPKMNFEKQTWPTAESIFLQWMVIIQKRTSLRILFDDVTLQSFSFFSFNFSLKLILSRWPKNAVFFSQHYRASVPSPFCDMI
jgi:hypothetical protein